MNNPYPTDLLGCIERTSYSLKRGPATYEMPALLGRSRVRKKDMYPTFQVRVALDFGQAQFAGWQQFWRSTGNGRDWFEMPLALAGPQEPCLCHATGPWSSSLLDAGYWSVTLNLEAVQISELETP